MSGLPWRFILVQRREKRMKEPFRVPFSPKSPSKQVYNGQKSMRVQITLFHYLEKHYMLQFFIRQKINFL